MQTITYACHTAHLDTMTGEGLLVLPRAIDNVAPVTGTVTLHEADWGQVVRHLDGLGWEPSEGEDGDWLHVGQTTDGRDIIGLYGRDPLVTDPSVGECADVVAALLLMASEWTCACPNRCQRLTG